MDFNPAARPSYTREQLQQYFDRISLPEAHRDNPIVTNATAAHTIEHGLPLLSALQRYQLASVPFENLTLHYDVSKIITLDPQHVFQKIVARNAGRGGYCMENSLLMLTVLRSLGYNVISTGARVNEAIQPQAGKKDWPGPRYDGWNHMVNIVELEGRRFLVDVGVGSIGPTRPVELLQIDTTEEGQDGKGVDVKEHDGGDGGWVNVPPQQRGRLSKKLIPDTTSHAQGQQLWVYEAQYSADKDWMPVYCFSETEFLPSDYVIMSHFTSTSRTSWFTWHVVCSKMIMNEGPEETEGTEKHIVGDVTLSGADVKRRIGGKTELLVTCETERERVEAVKKYLGVSLTDTEAAAIKGMTTAL